MRDAAWRNPTHAQSMQRVADAESDDDARRIFLALKKRERKNAARLAHQEARPHA